MIREGVMELHRIDRDFTVSKIDDISQVDFAQEFVFLAKTPDEISLVCESVSVPKNAIQAEAGWKAMRVTGVLEFGRVFDT